MLQSFLKYCYPNLSSIKEYMFTCYAIDDEPSALEILKDYISYKPNLSLLRTFDNSLTALDYITKNQVVDIIFLDVEMPEMSGVELAKLIRHKARKIVFVTAHTRYAYNSIELETDFLLKPFAFARFNNLTDKILATVSPLSKSKSDSFLIKKPGDRTTKHYVKFKEIIYLESKLRHTKIKTVKGEIMSDQPLAKIKELITEHNCFFQVHRSFIISSNYIRVLGHKNLIMDNDEIIPVGRNYRNTIDKNPLKN